MEVQVEVLVGGPVVNGTAVVSRDVLIPVAVQPGEPGLDRVLDGGLSGQQITSARQIHRRLISYSWLLL